MPARNFTDAEEEQIAKIYLAGHSARAIARVYGLNHHISILSALRRQGIKQRPASQRNRLYNVNPVTFDIIDTEETAYWLGMLYADGHIARHKTVVLDLKQSDCAHVERFRDFLSCDAPIKKRGSGGYHHVHFEITERHLATRLEQLGIVTRRPYPDRLITAVPNHLVHHCIRGYFDGDGSARRSPSIMFCGHLTLLEWLRETLALRAGINPNLTLTQHTVSSKIYYLHIGGRIQATNVARYMYQGATIWLERKRQMIDSWPQPTPRTRNSLGQYT